MKRLISFILILSLVVSCRVTRNDRVGVGNTYRYAINANGGIRVGGNDKPLIDSISNNGDGLKFYNGSSQLNPKQAGIFNVLDYGATNGGTVEDATAIQEAINTASTYIDVSEDGGATVYIPSGIWYIDKPDTLKSNIHILIDKNAQFRFPSAYEGAMWVNDTTEYIVRCTVEGGRFYQTSNKYTFAKLYSSQLSNYVMFVHFKDCYVESANIVFDLRTFGTGWINGNTVTNVIGWRPVEYLKMVASAGNSGMDGNVFLNTQIQPLEGTTTHAIHDLSGSYNQFINFIMWDNDAFSVGINISNDASYNTIIGSGISKAKFSNVVPENYNLVISDGLFLSGTSIFDNDNDTTLLGNDILNMNGAKVYAPKQIITYASNELKDSIDKLIISHTGDAGATGTPNGDIRLKILSYAANPSSYASANSAIGIMSRNQRSSNYGSWMYLQTHGTASSENYVDAQIIGPYGDISYNVVNTGGLGTSIAGDNLSRFVVYNGEEAKDLTADPQIVDGRQGQIITIIGTSDTNTLTLDDGAGLALSAQIVLGIGDTITLIYISTLDLWVEVSRSNN